MDTKIPLRKGGILSQQLGDEWLIYNTEKKSVHIINSMAELVWRMCDGSNDLNDIESSVRDTYLVPDGTDLGKDVESIIETFANLGIIDYIEYKK